MKLFIFLLTLFISVATNSQSLNLEIGEEINKVDSLGRKQGLYIFDGIVWTNFENGLEILTYGIYVDDKPTGLFETKIKSSGQLILRTIYKGKNIEEIFFYPNGGIAKIGIYLYRKNKKNFTDDLVEVEKKYGKIPKGGYAVKWRYYDLSNVMISKETFKVISKEFSYLRLH